MINTPNIIHYVLSSLYTYTANDEGMVLVIARLYTSTYKPIIHAVLF